MLFDLSLLGGARDGVEDIGVHHSFPCTSRIVLELILEILTRCKKYPSKIFFQRYGYAPEELRKS